jgi:hypothetical protein
MLARIRNPKIYPPVGSCIYCGEERDLSAEHIIPRSLNGAMLLPKASCGKCRKITAAFERTCCRTMFGPFRLRHGFRTRHKEERPSKIDIERTSDSGALESETVEISRISNLIFFLKFGHTANILLGSPNIDTSQVAPWIGFAKDGFLGEKGWVVGKFDAFAFARMLAKIAHSFAVAELGVSAFTPLGIDFMSGRANNLSRFVGGHLTDEPRSTSLHFLRLRSHLNMSLRQHFVVAHIRLFGCLGAPNYHVVAGEMPWDARPIGNQTIEAA